LPVKLQDVKPIRKNPTVAGGAYQNQPNVEADFMFNDSTQSEYDQLTSNKQSDYICNSDVNSLLFAREENSQPLPPAIDKGVEFCIDWVTVTIHANLAAVVKLVNDNFSMLGVFLEIGHGGMGYPLCLSALLGAKIYHSPKDGSIRCTVVIPGKACSAIPPEFLSVFHDQLVNMGVRFNYTRIDTAFTGVDFTPVEFGQAVKDNQIRSLAKRSTLRYIQSPYLEREDGNLGCDTVYLGSRESQRYLRVYNLHGPTRLEVEYKADRAQIVACAVLSHYVDDWYMIAVSHLRDFIDVNAKWWGSLIRGGKRAFAKIINAKEVAITELVRWLDNQVSPALSIVVDCLGFDILEWMIIRGRRRAGKYQALKLEFQEV
jgi:hypothetical protein